MEAVGDPAPAAGDGPLRFPAKKVLARWFRPPPVPQGHPALPRIFVSEVIVAELSPAARAIISRYTAASGGVSVGPGR